MKIAFSLRSQGDFQLSNASKPDMNKKFKKAASSGFSLSEVLITVSIAGILSGIAIPSYHRQYASSCQSQSENAINALMPAVQAYSDEFGTPATSWNNLDQISTLMTSNGPARGDNFQPVQLSTCNYWLEVTQTGNNYRFSATRGEEQPSGSEATDKLNVYGCLNVATGSSDIAAGNGVQPASSGSLSCN